MNRVIRAPRISKQTVRISVHQGVETSLPPEEPIEGNTLDTFDNLTGELDPSEIPKDNEQDTQDLENPPKENGNPEEQEEESQPEEETNKIPALSALEIETMVEERIKNFEERFQREKEEAYRAGFEDGRPEGLIEGKTHSQSEIERFQSIIKNLEAQWKDLLKNADLSLSELALAVAEKIIGSAVEVRKEPIKQAVGECLSYLQDKSRVIIKVHPDDLEVVRNHRNDWLESLEGIQQLIVESDSTIALGGCIVETPIGDVDAQIEERLERLRLALIEEIRCGDETK